MKHAFNFGIRHYVASEARGKNLLPRNICLKFFADANVYHRMSSGFSLVELSIVLVIIGVLTGGIMTGQNLIRNAKIKKVVSEMENYKTAIQIFRDKYNSLPGDMSDATSYWGDNTSVCADAGVTDGTPGTCNGNDNNRIDTAAAANTTGELFQFWNQLSLAGLIEGQYTGISGTAGIIDHNIGVNCPKGPIDNTGWGSSWTNNSSDVQTNVWPFDYNGWMTIGGDDGGWADNPNGIMTAEEVWNIDSKIDDSKPAQGRVHVHNALNCTDQTNNNTPLVAEYDLSDTSKECIAVFNYR